MELVLQTPQQHAIADLLWAAEDQSQVDEILRTYGHAAVVVHELMIAAAFDQDMDTDLAESVLRGF